MGRPGLGYLSRPGKRLGHPAVAAPVAGGDQVGHTAALQEGGCGHLALAEDPGEGDHLHEPQADDGGLGVVSAAEAITEAGSHPYNVLPRRQGSPGRRHTRAAEEDAREGGERWQTTSSCTTLGSPLVRERERQKRDPASVLPCTGQRAQIQGL